MTGRPFENLGLRLRTLREERGVSIREMSDKTRIPLHVLEGIEMGDPAGLPAPVFIKGFLRTMANELKVNPEEIINEYKMSNPDQTGTVAVPITARHELEKRSKGKAFFLFFLLIIAGSVVAGVYYYPKWKDGSLFSQKTVKSLPVPEPMQRETSEPPLTAPEPPADETVKPADAAVETDAPDNPPTAVETSSEPATATEPAPEETAPAAQPLEGHELKLVFQKESWVQVVIDNERLEHGLYGAGTEKIWKATNFFSLRLGNAGGVKVIFDGKDLGSVGPSGKAVSLKLPQ